MWIPACKRWLPLAALLVLGVARAGAPAGPAEPAPVKKWKEGALLQIGDKKYELKFVSGDAAPLTGWVERSETVCLWAKNKLYIIDPYCPKWQEPIPCSWSVLSVSADRSWAVVGLSKVKSEHLDIGVVDLK